MPDQNTLYKVGEVLLIPPPKQEPITEVDHRKVRAPPRRRSTSSRRGACALLSMAFSTCYFLPRFHSQVENLFDRVNGDISSSRRDQQTPNISLCPGFRRA